MGSVTSTFLTEEDYVQIHAETGFNEQQVRRLYQRFSHLDKRSKGYLVRQDLMLIPELAVNPLATHIIEAFFADDDDPGQVLDEVNFRQFVKTLSRFRKNSSSHNSHEMCSPDKKIEFVFRVYDKDHDGKISREDLTKILSSMVGLNIPKDQVNSIVKRTMKEADDDKDNFISLEEFKKALGDIDISEKLSISFSRT